MLLFNCINSIQSFLCASISKHLMLLFNLILHFIPPLPISISKHLMLLFNRNEQKGYQTIMVFQNISCYCLTTGQYGKLAAYLDFKTSHVIV